MTKFPPSKFPFTTPTTYDPGIVYVEQEIDKKTGEIVTPGRVDYLKGETAANDEPSLTVPDMALTVKEILYRFATNRPIPVAQNLVYTGDEMVPNPRSLDQMETIDAIRNNEAAIEQLQKNLQEVEEKRRERRRLQRQQAAAKKAEESGEGKKSDGGTT